MPTTSNFGWTTPADTDLVKDGALAIRTLGNGIDTSFLDLKGGTTGQNLRKASNTDLDFTFAGDATNTVVDAAGDLLYGTAADTLGRLAIGTAGQVLQVNSGATAPEWVSASSGGMTLLASGSLAGVSTVTTATISLTGYLQLYVQLIKPLPATDGAEHRVRFNADTGTTYAFGLADQVSSQAFDATSIRLSDGADNSSNVNSLNFTMHNPSSAGVKIIQCASICANNTTPANVRINNAPAIYNAAAAITSVTFFTSSGNWTSGDYYVYGVK